MKPRRKFSDEEKKNIVQKIDTLIETESLGIGVASSREGITSTDYQRWKKNILGKKGKRGIRSRPEMIPLPVSEISPSGFSMRVYQFSGTVEQCIDAARCLQ